MRNLWIDGKNLHDFGITVSGEGTYNAPEIDYETVTIPGRNGDILIDKNRYKSIPVTYPAGITTDFPKNAAAARLFLLGNGVKNRRIEDDYNPDTYRMGVFTGPIDFETAFLSRAAEMDLEFLCRPERWLKAGEQPIPVENGVAVANLWMETKPKIDIVGTGNGTISIGTSTITITGMAGGIVIDSETENAYYDYENMNKNIMVSGGFPKLQPGKTTVKFSGGIVSVQITPRWWTL